VTRGLSLYQQGKFAEALAATASLSADALKQPQVALYHGIFLTAAGDAAKAGEFLAVARDWGMLPEEKALLERARQAAAKAATEGEVAEAAKIARLARAANEAEGDRAVEIARAARAVQNAREAQAAKEVQAERAAAKAAAKAAASDVPMPSFVR
jgi:hypothetical protein